MLRAVWPTALAALCALLLGTPSASAQTGSPRPWTAIVSAHGGLQLSTNRLAQASELDKYVEPAPFTAELPKAAVPFVDGGVTVRLWKNLGIGAAVSFLSNTADAEVNAEIPHPFYFDRPRTIAGEASVGHRELAFHPSAAWLIESRRLAVLVFGGPSLFRLDQSLVTDVSFDEEFPYDAATFTEADVVRVQVSKPGVHLGIDVTWKRSPRWNVGGLVRYSRARVPLAVEGVEAGTVTIGGLVAGGGVRVIF